MPDFMSDGSEQFSRARKSSVDGSADAADRSVRRSEPRGQRTGPSAGRRTEQMGAQSRPAEVRTELFSAQVRGSGTELFAAVQHFTPAVETLLRTIAEAGDTGAQFKVEPRLRYRLSGTEYVVNQRSFHKLTADGYVTDSGNDMAPVKLTDRGHEWIRQHPVPHGGSRGPYRPRGTRPARRAPAQRPARFAYAGGFTAEIADRVVVITCPDNGVGGATLPADVWEQRAVDRHPTLHTVEGPTIAGSYALHWRADPRTDADLLVQSLAIVRAEPARKS
ncbi:hypothetical protein ACF08W_28805 [Streptomyces sp. NPDC015144]|uniref:hypothetical protein n=1 Tax=Streptomyces sp. NPDC015144 TaxID=3364944 RepID=UPI0036FF5302